MTFNCKNDSSSGSISVVLDQHTVDAAFLWLLRIRATEDPRYSLTELSRLDSRLEAHVDGLRISGSDGWKACRGQLSWNDPGEIFICAVVALESKCEAWSRLVLETVAQKPVLLDALVSALAWLSHETIVPYLLAWQTADSLLLQRASLAANATHRTDPGLFLCNIIDSFDLELQVRALRTIGELGQINLSQVVLEHLSASHSEKRFSAAWSAALLNGNALALEVLQEFVETGSEFAEKALSVAIRRMSLPAAHEWLVKLANETDSLRLAVAAAGAVGDPELIPWLMSLMPDPKLARVAGEAFTTITGVDIAYEDLDTKAPDNFEAGPNDDPADENVDLDPDENLPWPNPTAIEQWWGKHRHQFRAGERCLLGKPMNSDWLQQVLRIGRQRVRAAAALELAIRNPGQPLFNVAAPGFRQQELLGLRRW